MTSEAGLDKPLALIGYPPFELTVAQPPLDAHLFESLTVICTLAPATKDWVPETPRRVPRMLVSHILPSSQPPKPRLATRCCGHLQW
jgi:hypothetical protein